MTLGYARPLEASDLWKLQEHRSSQAIAEIILESFDARQKEADEYNARLANGEIKPPLRLRFVSMLRGNREERVKRWREKDGKKKPSLTMAMNDSIKWWFWSGGLLKVIGDTAQITSPLILKVGRFLRIVCHTLPPTHALCLSLVVPHQLHHHFLRRPSRGPTSTRHREGSRSRSRPHVSTSDFLALSKSLLLSKHVIGCLTPGWSHYGDLFALPSLDHSCTGNVAQWQISQSHLYRCLTDRFLLWLLPYVLDCAHPDGDLSRLAHRQFGAERARGVLRLRSSHAHTGEHHEDAVQDSTKDNAVDGQEGETAARTSRGHEANQVFCLGKPVLEPDCWI